MDRHLVELSANNLEELQSLIERAEQQKNELAETLRQISEFQLEIGYQNKTT